MTVVFCKRCGKEFRTKPSWLMKGFGKYCSADCHHQMMRTGEERACDICGKLSYKKPKALFGSKSGKFFCSKHCQTLWRNQLYIGDKHKNFRTGEATYR